MKYFIPLMIFALLSLPLQAHAQKQPAYNSDPALAPSGADETDYATHPGTVSTDAGVSQSEDQADADKAAADLAQQKEKAKEDAAAQLQELKDQYGQAGGMHMSKEDAKEFATKAAGAAALYYAQHKQDLNNAVNDIKTVEKQKYQQDQNDQTGPTGHGAIAPP